MGSPSPKDRDAEKNGTQSHHQAHSPPPSLPAPPDPATDPAVVPSINTPPDDAGAIPEDLDIFTLTSVAALKMLCGMVETLIKFTGDVPPTPPTSDVGSPPRTTQQDAEGQPRKIGASMKENMAFGARRDEHDHIDGVPFVKTPIGSPEAHHSEPVRDIGAGAEPIGVQHLAIARKFYSKKPPPIALEEYLMRLHRYCPMSTAVYLATALYINRLAVVERIIPVTPRNAHRLVLGALRVAMKALEDLSYPHRRFAKVGGVSEIELGRLEISFCFLTNFELKVTPEMLLDEATSLKDGATVDDEPVPFQMKIPVKKEKRKASSTLPSRPLPRELIA